jgi:hypothetical protein
MATGVESRLWEIGDIVKMVEEVSKRGRRLWAEQKTK